MKLAAVLVCLAAALSACGERKESSIGITGTAAEPYPEPPASAAASTPAH